MPCQYELTHKTYDLKHPIPRHWMSFMELHWSYIRSIVLFLFLVRKKEGQALIEQGKGA